MTQYPDKLAPLKYARKLLGVPETADTTEQLEIFSQWISDMAEARGKWWVEEYQKHIRDFWMALETQKINIEKTEFQPFAKTKPGLIVSLHAKADKAIENTDSNGVYEAIVDNFSAQGMYCKAAFAIKPEVKIKIRFENTSPDSSPIIFTGIVKWCRELNGDSAPYSHGIGIQLETTAPDTLQTIISTDSD